MRLHDAFFLPEYAGLFPAADVQRDILVLVTAVFDDTVEGRLRRLVCIHLLRGHRRSKKVRDIASVGRCKAIVREIQISREMLDFRGQCATRQQQEQCGDHQQ